MHEPIHDIVIIGAGAAGLFAATWAGRAARDAGRAASIVALDGARKLGAKILVAGGGRCNVTHWKVTEADFAGSSPPAIRKVLGRFGVEEAVAFFQSAGVKLKREETGKLFPVTDSARTVLEALLREARAAGVVLRHPARVERIAREAGRFVVTTDSGSVTASRVILATGGRSLPKSGSDGLGHDLARSLGHSISDPVVPALVPLVLAEGHWISRLSGLTLPAELTLRSTTLRRPLSCSGSTLCTHFGLSGPAVLDMSRHYLVARHRDPSASLSMSWMPGLAQEAVERIFLDSPNRPAIALLRDRLPERLARELAAAAGAADGPPTREARRSLVRAITETPLLIERDRGYAVAEATAGGVPLSEVRLDSMESRLCPGLFFAGEILDVDGRIGGFNFQWAWASGFVAGSAAASTG